MRRAILALIGLPVGLLALIGLEVALLTRREFLPPDPGYRIDAVVQPVAGSTAPVLELAVLGDSTVAGVGSATEAESLAVLVAQRVADALVRPVHVVGHGVAGARTATVSSPARARSQTASVSATGSTRVSGPGQNRAASRSARSSKRATRRAMARPATWAIRGLKLGRPLAA